MFNKLLSFQNPSIRISKQILYLFLASIIVHLSRSQQASPNVVLQYSQNQNVYAYSNNLLNPDFAFPTFSYSCSNSYLFTYNQTQQQYNDNSPYLIIVSNMVGQFNINVSNTYKKIPIFQNVSTCSGDCAVQLQNSCTKERDFDLIKVSITGIPTIYYNVICDSSLVFSPFQYGLVILTIFSVFQIVVSAKFQGGSSFSNKGHYFNYITLAIYCFFLLVGEVLIILNASETQQAVQITELVMSLLVGFIGCFISMVQFLFCLRVKILKISFRVIKLNVRIMDIIGLIFAAGMVLAWYFSSRNWIISDIIYVMIFLAIVKFIKFGSLKIAIVSFICIAACQILFIVLTQQVNHIYFNNLIPNIFNSPLFIFCPCINYAPNQNCSWLFLTAMVYPSMLLSYLDRVDYSRSSRIYFIVYVTTLVISSAGWIIISVFAPFTLPFDIISSPICFSILCIYAFRRGQLRYLWDGQIFDSLHKNRQDEINQIMDSLKDQRSDSYKSEWFRIKYSALSVQSVRSAISNQPKMDLQMQNRREQMIQGPSNQLSKIEQTCKTQKFQQ